MITRKNFFVIYKLIITIICSLALISPVLSQSVSLTVSWNQNSEDDIFGYKVYWGTRHQQYDHHKWVSENNTTLEDLRSGLRYYVVVTAVDYWGNESAFSDEVSQIAGSTEVPAYLVLETNYPNPFNHDTAIEFSIPERTNVNIHIFNRIGQLVKDMRIGPLDSGRHVRFWDGLDDQGNRVSSGIYYYQLRSGSESITKKMSLVR